MNKRVDVRQVVAAEEKGSAAVTGKVRRRRNAKWTGKVGRNSDENGSTCAKPSPPPWLITEEEGASLPSPRASIHPRARRPWPASKPLDPPAPPIPPSPPTAPRNDHRNLLPSSDQTAARRSGSGKRQRESAPRETEREREEEEEEEGKLLCWVLVVNGMSGGGQFLRCARARLSWWCRARILSPSLIKIRGRGRA
jgi:hypothetical protein